MRKCSSGQVLALALYTAYKRDLCFWDIRYLRHGPAGLTVGKVRRG